jgi:hypothetical protein
MAKIMQIAQDNFISHGAEPLGKSKIKMIICHPILSLEQEMENKRVLTIDDAFRPFTKKKTCEIFLFNKIADKVNHVLCRNKIDDKTEENDDNMCAICWDTINPPIAYIKTCGHYFCKSCIDIMMKHGPTNCPNCREPFNKYNIIIVQEMSDINNSSKIHELLNIINHSSNGEKYIITAIDNNTANVPQISKSIHKIAEYIVENGQL